MQSNERKNLDSNESAEDYKSLAHTESTKQAALTPENINEIEAPYQKERKTSLFTRIPAGVFRYELLPFFEHPKELLVLFCVNRHHWKKFNDRSQLFVNHFSELNEELKS